MCQLYWNKIPTLDVQKNLPIQGVAYKDFKPVSLSKQLKSIPFTQPGLQIQCMRGRFQITHVLSSQKCSSTNAQFSYFAAVICEIHKIVVTEKSYKEHKLPSFCGIYI